MNIGKDAFMSRGTIITEDGEILENVIYYTEEETAAIQRYKENKHKSDLIPDKYKSYFKRFITEFNKIDNLDCQEATRLMYLATYVSYDNNILKFDNGKNINKRDMKRILNLSDAMSRRFISSMIKKNYLIEMDDGFQINKNIIHRGYDEDRPLGYTERYTKIYIQAMRKMYLSVEPRQHKFLGYVFQMLPYVNVYHNILCFNPFEKDYNEIKDINMIDLCRIIGLNTENVTQFRRNAEKVLFEFNGTLQHFMCYVLGAEDESKNQGIIIINPNILYGENEINRQDALKTFYKKDKDLKKKLKQPD